jgi:hypothetical protein
MISAAKPPLSPTCSIGPHERSEAAHHLRASLVNIVATEPARASRPSGGASSSLGRPRLGKPRGWGAGRANGARSRAVVLISVPSFPEGFALPILRPPDRPRALSRRPISGRAVGLLPLLPHPLRPDGQRPRRGHLGDPCVDLSAREPRLLRQGFRVCLDDTQWRPLWFGASRPAHGVRPRALAARRHRRLGRGVPRSRFSPRQRWCLRRHRQHRLRPRRD